MQATGSKQDQFDLFDREAAARMGLEDTATFDEITTKPPIVGYGAFSVDTGRRYVTLAELDEPAGECRVAPSGVVTDWVDCDPDEAVFWCVSFETLRNKPEDWRSVDHIREAGESERIQGRYIPESSLAPLAKGISERIKELRQDV